MRLKCAANRIGFVGDADLVLSLSASGVDLRADAAAKLRNGHLWRGASPTVLLGGLRLQSD